MMVKTLIRSAVSLALEATGSIRRSETASRGSLTILCYHRILPKREKEAYLLPDLAVTPDSFDVQCSELRRHYNVLPLCEAADLLYCGYDSDMPLAAITFDDGYRDNFLHAGPILRQHGLRATFFVIAGLAGSREAPWYDRLGRAAQMLRSSGLLEKSLNALGHPEVFQNMESPTRIVQAVKRLPPDQRIFAVERLEELAGGDRLDPTIDTIMQFQELVSLSKEGHEIGSHSLSHEILTSLDDDEITREIHDSKTQLESGLGSSVRSFCYPNGDYDSRVLDSIRGAGYDYACTTKSGKNEPSDSPIEMKRRFICEDRLIGCAGGLSAAIFRMELTGLADAVFMRVRGKGH
jgi:peptidoglycan/xylan/chitin deacetylase (PgdA/CDA1 family)